MGSPYQEAVEEVQKRKRKRKSILEDVKSRAKPGTVLLTKIGSYYMAIDGDTHKVIANSKNGLSILNYVIAYTRKLDKKLVVDESKIGYPKLMPAFEVVCPYCKTKSLTDAPTPMIECPICHTEFRNPYNKTNTVGVYRVGDLYVAVDKDTGYIIAISKDKEKPVGKAIEYASTYHKTLELYFKDQLEVKKKLVDEAKKTLEELENMINDMKKLSEEIGRVEVSHSASQR